ncbi:MAG: tetratricopeptide repeat protein [Planctomycetota bacterium]
MIALLSRVGLLAIALGLSALLALLGCGRKDGVAPIRSHFNLGVAHFDDQQWDAAAASYRRALSEDPSDRRARFNLAVTLELAARDAADEVEAAQLRTQSAEELEELLRRHPDDLRAMLNLAALAGEQDGLDAGRTKYQSATEAHPRSAEAFAAYASFLLGQEEPEDSADQAQRALAIDPGSFAGNVALGDAKLALGDLDTAAEAYETALRTHPDQPVVLRTLARLEFERGRAEEAEVYARRALLIDPDAPAVHRLASRIAEQQGAIESAVYHTWRARDLSSSPEQAERDRQTLSRLYGRLTTASAAE